VLNGARRRWTGSLYDCEMLGALIRQDGKGGRSSPRDEVPYVDGRGGSTNDPDAAGKDANSGDGADRVGETNVMNGIIMGRSRRGCSIRGGLEIVK